MSFTLEHQNLHDDDHENSHRYNHHDEAQEAQLDGASSTSAEHFIPAISLLHYTLTESGEELSSGNFSITWAWPDSKKGGIGRAAKFPGKG